MSPGDPAWAKGRFRIGLKKQEGFVSVSVLYILQESHIWEELLGFLSDTKENINIGTNDDEA